MKICKKCNKEKRESEFGILKSHKSGSNPNCKECQCIKAREWASRPGNREKVNKSAAKFRRTKKGKIVKKRYYNSPKGQTTYKKYNEQTRSKKARSAVNHEIEKGRMLPAKALYCIMSDDGQCEGRMEYHHHKGYNKNNWYNVIPLCRKHHCIIDGQNYHSV